MSFENELKRKKKILNFGLLVTTHNSSLLQKWGDRLKTNVKG